MPWGLLDAALILFAFLFIGSLAATALGQLPGDLGPGLSLPVSSAALGATVVAYVALRYRAELRLLLGDGRWSVSGVLLGIGHGVVALGFNLVVGFAITVFAERFGTQVPIPQEGIRELLANPATVALALVAVVVLTPIAEELFFRGVLFQGLWRRLGRWPAIGLAGLLFALAHPGDTALVYLYHVVILFPVGMYMCWVLARYRHLAVTMAMHGVYNLVAVAGILSGWL